MIFPCPPPLDKLKSLFDLRYSQKSHNHNGDYAPIDHTHPGQGGEGAEYIIHLGDTAPDGYARVTGYDDRFLYNVASGAGGTGGNSSHSHWLAPYVPASNWTVGQAVATFPSYSNMLGTYGGSGGDSIMTRLGYTENTSHIPPYLKIILCQKIS